MQESIYLEISKFSKLKLVETGISKYLDTETWNSKILNFRNTGIKICQNLEIFQSRESQKTEILKSWNTELLEFPNRVFI